MKRQRREWYVMYPGRFRGQRWNQTCIEIINTLWPVSPLSTYLLIELGAAL